MRIQIYPLAAPQSGDAATQRVAAKTILYVIVIIDYYYDLIIWYLIYLINISCI